MAIKVSIDKFPFGFPSKVLAREGGKHIYNVTLKEDTPNGVFIGKGAFVELDRYDEAAAGSVTGNIVAKAANGNFYVEIDTVAEDTLFVYQAPVIAEEYSNKFMAEDNFYNPAGTVVRAYELAHGDIIELNAKALNLSADPSTYPTAVTASTYGTATYAKQLA